jgi:hypothetical protein
VKDAIVLIGEVGIEMKSNNPLELVENYIGEPLTVTWATRLAEAPIEHIIDLMNEFSPFYYDWLRLNDLLRVHAHASSLRHLDRKADNGSTNERIEG